MGSAIIIFFTQKRKFLSVWKSSWLRTYFLISPTFDHYIIGRLSYKRLFITQVIRMATIITCVRYGISALFDTPYLRWLTSNANYKLGNHLIISLFICTGIFCHAVISVGISYLEICHKFNVIAYMHKIKKDKHLDKNMRQKFFKQMNYIEKYMSYPMFCLLYIVIIITFSAPPFMAYFDNQEYSLILNVAWTVVFMVWAVDFYSMIFGVFRLWSLSLVYLKYEFTQINHDINLAINNRDFALLMRSLRKHNKCCIKTAILNKQLKYLIMVIYKFVKPALNLVVYTSMAPDSQWPTRIGTGIVFWFVFIILFVLNSMCASVTSAAHKSRKGL